MVLLEKVTPSNRAEVCALAVRPEQADRVWKNEDWVEVAFADPSWQLYAVRYGETPVGMAVLTKADGGQEYKLVYLMIDGEWQGIGYGRQAVEALGYRLRKADGADHFLAEAKDAGEEELLSRLGLARTGAGSRFFVKDLSEEDPLVSLRQIGVTQLFLCREELDKTQPGTEALPAADIGIGFPVLLGDHHPACARLYAGETRARIRILPVDERTRRCLRQQWLWTQRFSVGSLEVLCDRIVSRAGYRRMWERRLERMQALVDRYSDAECEEMQEKGAGLALYGASEDGKNLYFEDEMGMSYVLEENGMFYNERTGIPAPRP